MSCGSSQISLGASSDNCVDCNSGFSGSYSDNEKFDFLCDMLREELNIILVVTLTILCFGMVCFAFVMILMCKVKGYLCFRRDEEEQQREQEDRIKRRMRLIELKLNTIRYDKIKNEERS